MNKLIFNAAFGLKFAEKFILLKQFFTKMHFYAVNFDL